MYRFNVARLLAVHSLLKGKGQRLVEVNERASVGRSLEAESKRTGSSQQSWLELRAQVCGLRFGISYGS